MSKEKKESKINRGVVTAIVAFVLSVVVNTSILTVYQSKNTEDTLSTKESLETSELDSDRFDILTTQIYETENVKIIMMIVADRETDVEYLVVDDPRKGGLGITLMRDSGGVVLRRE